MAYIQLSNSHCLFPLLLLLILGQNDHQAAEDVDEIQEQINGVPDVIPVSSTAFLHNQLSIVQQEATEHKQASIQLHLLD